jgi:hypothetical protein
MRFSASRIGELLAKGSGKTAQSYLLDLSLQSLGIKDDMQTAAMRHGLVNQHNAYELLVKSFFPEAKWHDESILIDERCSASPDVLIGDVPMDIKCPYNVDNFFDQCENVPKKYYLQVQMQMMATKASEGYLLFYLSKPEVFGEENWQEYPVAIEERYKLFRYDADADIQAEIMDAVDKYHPLKLQVIELLKSAKDLEWLEYFTMQKQGYSLRPLKEASNLFNMTECYRVRDKFYYLKSK